MVQFLTHHKKPNITYLLYCSSPRVINWQAILPGLECVWLASASVKGYVYMAKKYLSHILATLSGALLELLLVVYVGCVADRFITGCLLKWSGLLCIDTCQSHSLILGGMAEYDFSGSFSDDLIDNSWYGSILFAIILSLYRFDINFIFISSKF